MTTSVRAPVVDSDGHVLEPADTWLTYLEPAYRTLRRRAGAATSRSTDRRCGGRSAHTRSPS
jgi:hypothetical protein